MVSYPYIFKNKSIWVKANTTPNKYDYIWGFYPCSKHGHAAIKNESKDIFQQISGMTATFSGTAMLLEVFARTAVISGTILSWV